MGSGRWGGRDSPCAGTRDAPEPDVAEELEEGEAKDAEPCGRRGGRPSPFAGARDKEHGLVTDPPVSEAQRKAMFAAKAGKSNLGIPKSVGAEFANADPGGKLPEHK